MRETVLLFFTNYVVHIMIKAEIEAHKRDLCRHSGRECFLDPPFPFAQLCDIFAPHSFLCLEKKQAALVRTSDSDRAHAGPTWPEPLQALKGRGPVSWTNWLQ